MYITTESIRARKFSNSRVKKQTVPTAIAIQKEALATVEPAAL